ncbi:MAG TPA: HAMP domain-containing sensor histidine kinase, partial [Phycisphaerales bacterium]|nr:HAMP domain-containing sensor histidine kinase [Phycisphaerales bacterium]
LLEASDSGAGRHGVVRAMEGFTLDQMLSEYRALRASVLRLWTRKGGIDKPSEAEQVTRFNEAIDEALADSAKKYARDVERMIAAAHAKERLAALGTLTAGLGHDMSNVLMPMRVSLDQLAQTSLPPDSMVLLDSLRRSMEHLRGLTGGLRSLSVDPSDTGGGAATTRLNDWWAEAISPYRWALCPDVQLHAEGLDSLALPPVAVPKHVLMQAVFNLVQNACDVLSTQGAGNIWVSATLAKDGATVSVAVRDDGPGMTPEVLSRCTEPFFTTKPRGRGTGLGLSLVRSALERQGGRLVIESSFGKGSTFTLVMPVAGRGDRPQGLRQAFLTVQNARVRAMIAALLSPVGVSVSIQRPTAEPVVEGTEAASSRRVLWVVDDSVAPADVLRFLNEGGPDVRVVVLGTLISRELGGAGEAAAHDGQLIQIAAVPDIATLRGALRRAVTAWVP